MLLSLYNNIQINYLACLVDNLCEVYENILSYGEHKGKTINISNKYQNICIRCANSSGGTPNREAYDYRIMPTSFNWVLKFRILGSTGDYISSSVEFGYNSSTRNLVISNITTVGIEIKGMYFR